MQSQNLSFLRKNAPLYGLPQNQQLRKSTAASPPKSAATYRQLQYPQNRQLRKSTAASLPKSVATYRQLPHPLNRRLHKSTAVTTPQNRQLRKSTAVSPPKSSVTQPTTDTPSPVESNTLKVLPVESIVDAFTAITTTAVPHTSTSPTTGHPGKSSVPHTSASLTFKNPAKPTYNANDFYEIDGLHEINCFEHGYWEGMGTL